MRTLLLLVLLTLTSTAQAKLMIWDFEVLITEDVDDDLNVFNGLSIGDTFTGYFGYDDGLTQTNVDDYVNEFNDGGMIFGINSLPFVNSINWTKKEVSVVHQRSRDIVDFEMYSDTATTDHDLEIGFLDDNSPYGQGVLPLNWHNLSDGADTPEFELDLTNPVTEMNSYIFGEVQSFTLRPSVDVPGPSTFIIFVLGMMGLVSRRFKS